MQLAGNLRSERATLIKKKLIFLIYKEIQTGAVAKSYMTNGLLMTKYLRISSYTYEEALPHI
jgi:hypothetical protein